MSRSLLGRLWPCGKVSIYGPFNCCGIFGPQDYEGSAWMTQDLGKGDAVAKTCCILSNGDHLDPKPLNSSWCQSDKPAESSQFRHEEVTAFSKL
ncbi:hypothetical protein AVEN_113037-1 [Araneus ventricosus]|uniref:Uncharacterized protein n=1 Tax=Araneus ventricosus TaxID=182803 RepID=A0A4Y2I8L1_ARAVE|nr:hypothetical protein AVEN_113037-1 [Araneus ventricosus]